MGAMSRNKGSRGERELARLLSEELGLDVTRNLLQTREGGHDLDGVPGWCLEVKRRAKVVEGDKRQWWDQAYLAASTLQQMTGRLQRPALLYRQDRGQWRAIVDWGAINPEAYGDAPTREFEYTAEVGLQGFCMLVRETL